MNVSVRPLDPATFAPFGQVLSVTDRAPEGRGPGWQWWGGLTVLPRTERGFQVGTLHLEPTELRFTWAERHHHTPELLIPVGGPCAIHVAPPLDHPQLGDFQVFEVHPGQAALLGPGVWHGAPLARSSPAQVYVLLQAQSGELDTELLQFDEVLQAT